MSQTREDSGLVVKEKGLETPPPKRIKTECPPAPIKVRPSPDPKNSDSRPLTKNQIQQLREDWKEASKGSFASQ